MENKQKYTFRKNEKLISEKSINQLFVSKKSFVEYPIRVVYNVIPLEEKEEETVLVKVLISVSKKRFKSAVKRNRIKRLMREAYRLNKQVLFNSLASESKALHLGFIYIDTEIKDFAIIDKKMNSILRKIAEKVV